MSPDDVGVLFAEFVKLLDSISRVSDNSNNSLGASSSRSLVKEWVHTLKQYHSRVPAATCKIFFRLFFPEEDVRRRYNIQETTLAKSLVQLFSLSVDEGSGKRLMRWSDMEDRTNLGCLGIEIERALLLRHSGDVSALTLKDVDRLLDELACLSGYSHLDIRKKRSQSRPRMTILKDIFHTMSPSEAKFMAQIILKDLHPVLYPIKETNTTRALIHHKSNEKYYLTKWEVMHAWHPSMPKIYRLRATLDAVSDAFEDSGFQCNGYSPLLGIPIETPKSQKGRSISHALQLFKAEPEIWAETKYDGERMQIHIDLSKSYNDQITIFSKSKRDSTMDRMGTHSIIRAALNLPLRDFQTYPQLLSRIKFASPRFTHSVILDAEMVAYSERESSIDEFWRIRSLVGSTAFGIRSNKHQTNKGILSPVPCETQSTQASDTNADIESFENSLVSNASDCSTRHLKLVFFDVMFIDDLSLLERSYKDRRAQLESLINPIPGFVSLSHRERVNLRNNAVQTVARIFSEHIASYQEGIVLKGAGSAYNDRTQPWVKLKRDYIPGYGDTIDLVLLGAGWNKTKARELRVAPQTFTTFFVGALKPNSKMTYPDFQVLFIVEYGLCREELEMLNFYIRHAGFQAYPNDQERLSYRFSLSQTICKPAVMLVEPLLSELYGAGFTKECGALYYSLRFPRLTKVWRPIERPWTAGVNLDEFQRLANLAVGHESSNDWANRSVESMWGSSHKLSAPRDRSIIAKRFEQWYQRLLKSEGLHSSPGSRGDISPRLTNGIKRKAEMQNQLTKRIKLYGHNSQTCADNSPMSTPQAKIRKFWDNSNAVAVMKKMIPMSPGSRAIRDDQIVVVDISQILSQKARRTITEECSIRGNSESAESNVSFIEDDSVKMNDHVESKNYPSRWKDCPIIKFIQDAYVWIPKDCQGKRPPTRPPASCIIPRDRRIGIIYFLLIICGCRIEIDGVVLMANDTQFQQANKCVIFVDTEEEPDKREALQWLMYALQSWKHELNRKGCKELFVFDSKLLTFQAMLSSTSPDNIEEAAIWRSRNL